MAECVGKDKENKCYKKPRSIFVKCHAIVVTKMALKMGLKIVPENQLWDICWTAKPVSIDFAKCLKTNQKLNHFVGMTEITRKDNLSKNLNLCTKKFPTQYDFYNTTWMLPEEYEKLKAFSESNKNVTFILKPRSGSGGRGIYLTQKISDDQKQESSVCQIYLSKPLLMDKYKFDMRVYVLITSCHPLSVFVYKNGLIRLATVPYETPTSTNINNNYMHLTNYSLNKKSPTFNKSSESGSKRDFYYFEEWLRNKNKDVSYIWSLIDDVILKTIIAGISEVKKSYKDLFLKHTDHSACFQILGFDIIIGPQSKPYLLEVNGSPSLLIDGKVDKEVKENLVYDTMKLLFFGKKEGEYTESDFFEFEDNNIGNYRRIYPASDSFYYDQFLPSPTSPTLADEHLAAGIGDLSLSVDKPSDNFPKRK